MRRFKTILLVLLLSVLGSSLAAAQNISFSGTVTDRSSGLPVEFATIILDDTGQWAMADAKGAFSVKNVAAGKHSVTISCLGYVTLTETVQMNKDIAGRKFILDQDNLALEGAVVTAQDNGAMATTSRTIDRTALEHVQVMNVSDIASLLPGGATSNPTLTSSQALAIRSADSEQGSSSFGTAVELDGVRLSNNASFSGASSSSTNLKGVSTNNIASSNIESVEVITGVPSVEYGDMTSGVVKIQTKKGKTPFTFTASTSPNTKQVSLSKGFSLNKKGTAGVLNTSMEYTRSISEQMSPYTSYDRKQLSLTYSNTFSRGAFSQTPLRFSASVSGNLGGLNNSADPDKQLETFTINRDNALRGNITADLLLSKKWITNIELNASAVYSDKLSRTNSFYSSAVSSTSLHNTAQGYVMADLIAPGYWYNTMAVDDKPFTAKVTLKANWVRNFGKVNSKIKLGFDWNADKNFGVGEYSEDEATSPTYRPYVYRDIPMMSNAAAYFEENLMIPAGNEGRINVIAGVRNDNTIIKGSAYGVTSSVSPRFNLKYTILSAENHKNGFLRGLALRGSWGVAVKQPSFSVLYPTPSYYDLNVFSSTVSADNTLYRAYYTVPHTISYNSALRWQRSLQSEVGIDLDLAGNKVSLAGFYNRSKDNYAIVTDYTPFTYTYTSSASVQSSSIPSQNRVYTIDSNTGVVTIHDKTGAMKDETVAHSSRNQFISGFHADNDTSPITRYGLEWVVDFKKIKPINTSIRLDGSWYGYRALNTDIRAYSPYTTSSYDGTPYKYVGYYIGGNGLSNGQKTESLKTNITVTTNIPKARMIISMKLESTFIRRSRYLSEGVDSKRAYVLGDRSNILSFTDASIYDGNSYAVVFPETYSSIGSSEQKPYLETLLWAKSNDPELFADLSKLALSSSYVYYFAQDSISPYFSANFSVTKEIGNLASISFYANNFFNNLSQVYSKKSGTYSSVSSYIPRFYYGMTVRLKF